MTNDTDKIQWQPKKMLDLLKWSWRAGLQQIPPVRIPPRSFAHSVPQRKPPTLSLPRFSHLQYSCFEQLFYQSVLCGHKEILETLSGDSWDQNYFHNNAQTLFAFLNNLTCTKIYYRHCILLHSQFSDKRKKKVNFVKECYGWISKNIHFNVLWSSILYNEMCKYCQHLCISVNQMSNV